MQLLDTNPDFPSLGYDVYDRFSKPYQKLFDSLTVTYVGDGFLKAAAAEKPPCKTNLAAHQRMWAQICR